MPQVRATKYGKKSFRFAAAVQWHSFPDNFRQVSSFYQFKDLVSCWSVKTANVIYVLGSCSAGCPEFNRMFVDALSVLFSFVCSILSLMLIHDWAVLAPAMDCWSHDCNMMYNCVIIYVLMFILAGMPT